MDKAFASRGKSEFITVQDLPEIKGVVIFFRIKLLTGLVQMSGIHGRLENDPAFKMNAGYVDDGGYGLSSFGGGKAAFF